MVFKEEFLVCLVVEVVCFFCDVKVEIEVIVEIG